jgi:UDP-N-acetylglucosamine 3-dehydrogenase
MAKRDCTVGVIGLGFGRSHIPAFQANGCRVVAVCQRNRAHAQEIAAAYGVEGVFDRWEDLLEKARPDVVVIATPPHLHKAIALAAFAQGAHVLCEKPVALTADEGREILDAATRAQRTAMTNFNWRSPAAFQRFHQMVQEGFLGRLLHVQVRWLFGRFADESTPVTWRMDPQQAGFGTMGDAGVHAIDFIRWNFGEIVRVAAQASTAYPAKGGTEDMCHVIAELPSGAQVSLAVSRVARGANEQTVEAYGTAGALRYALQRDQPRWWRGQLHATTGANGAFQPVLTKAVVPRTAGDGALPDVIGKTTIAPLVKRFLAGVRAGDRRSRTAGGRSSCSTRSADRSPAARGRRSPPPKRPCQRPPSNVWESRSRRQA